MSVDVYILSNIPFIFYCKFALEINKTLLKTDFKKNQRKQRLNSGLGSRCFASVFKGSLP